MRLTLLVLLHSLLAYSQYQNAWIKTIGTQSMTGMTVSGSSVFVTQLSTFSIIDGNGTTRFADSSGVCINLGDQINEKKIFVFSTPTLTIRDFQGTILQKKYFP